MLQEGEGDHRKQRVMMQTDPRASLEVIEAKLLFHLLVRLLARPARFDRGNEHLERGVLGVVG